MNNYSGHGAQRSRFLGALLLLATVLAPNLAAAANVQVSLAWDQPRNGDGSLFTAFTGYRVYYRTASTSYNTTNRRTVSGVGNTTYAFTDLTAGTYYFVVRSYNATPDNESSDSNEAGIHSLQPQLEIGPVTVRPFSVKVYNPGGSTPLSTLTLTTNNEGILALPIASGMQSTADIWIKTDGYLAAKQTQYSFGTLAPLPALRAGDINNDNRVDIGDAQIMSADWFTTNARSNFDTQPQVNISDAQYLNANWFAQGAP